MPQPYEIIMSPADVWIAFEGEAFPAVDASVSGNWFLLGSAGKRNQAEEGVTITHGANYAEHETAGSSGPVKVVRTSESLEIAMTIEDLTLEQYALALNRAPLGAIAQAAGVAGAKTMPLRQGLDVTTLSLLIRFPSPYGDAMNAQYQVPRVYQSAAPAPKFASDGTAAGLKLAFKALEDINALNDGERFGLMVAQTTLPA